jgi:hypothetical protein
MLAISYGMLVIEFNIIAILFIWNVYFSWGVAIEPDHPSGIMTLSFVVVSQQVSYSVHINSHGDPVSINPSVDLKAEPQLSKESSLLKSYWLE